MLDKSTQIPEVG